VETTRFNSKLFFIGLLGFEVETIRCNSKLFFIEFLGSEVDTTRFNSKLFFIKLLGSEVDTTRFNCKLFFIVLLGYEVETSKFNSNLFFIGLFGSEVETTRFNSKLFFIGLLKSEVEKTRFNSKLFFIALQATRWRATKDYLKSCYEVYVYVQHPNEEMVVDAFVKGLRANPSSEFLLSNKVESMTDIHDRPSTYIEAKEEIHRKNTDERQRQGKYMDNTREARPRIIDDLLG